MVLVSLFGCSTGSGPLVVATGNTPDAAADASAPLRTSRKLVGDEVEKSSPADFDGEVIDVVNENGDVWVGQTGPGGKVHAAMAPFAFTDSEADADALAVQQGVVATFSITQANGKITVRCGRAAADVGTSRASSSGCQTLAVWIPSTKGIALNVKTSNGAVRGPALIAASGAVLTFRSDNGSVDVGVTGSAKVSSGNGDVKLDAVPTKGSTLTVETGNGDIELALQNDFAADALSFSAGAGIRIEGFDDLQKDSTSRGPKGVGAKTIVANASALGALRVRPRF